MDPKKFVQNWPKEGNHLKKVHFLGKVVFSENPSKIGLNLLKSNQNYIKNIA